MRCRAIAFLLLTLELLSAPFSAAAQPAEPVRRIGYLGRGHGHGSRSQYLLDAFQHGLRELGVTLHSVEVRRPDDVDSALVAVAAERPDALIVFSEPLTLGHQRRIVDFATRHRLPMISEISEFAEAGGLMTYGASLSALFRRAAYYVDRILRGAQPSELPVEQPTVFELVINLKTAQTLGLTLPPTLLFQADKVIQ